MLFLLRPPKRRQDQTSIAARERWELPKALTRFYLAMLTMILVVIGIELSTPGQHLSELTVTYLAQKAPTAHWIFTHDWVSRFFQTHVDPKTRDIIYSGTTAKTVVMLLLLFFYFAYTVGNDPLSNTQLLRNINTALSNQTKYKLPLNVRYISELHFYAKHTPSARLEALCAGCEIKTGCGNSIGKHATDSALTLWTTIFHQLPANTIHELLFRTARCRAALLLRYSVWVSAVSLTIVYPVARFFEWLRGAPVELNIALIVYIAALFCASFLVGYFLYGGENARGIWGHFKDCVDNIFGSTEFQQLAERHVCRRPYRIFQYATEQPAAARTAGNQLQRMLTLVNFLDMLVQRKALAIVSGASQAKGLDSHLKNILFSLIEMYRRFDGKDHSFRAALLTNSPALEYLDPVVFLSFGNATYTTFSDRALIQRDLAKKGDSIAARALQSGLPISASCDTIPHFHREQAAYQKSIFAFPLVIPPEITNALREKGYQLPSPAAVLVIDTDDEMCFAQDHHKRNEVFIRPFANRIAFEIAIAALQTKETRK